MPRHRSISRKEQNRGPWSFVRRHAVPLAAIVVAGAAAWIARVALLGFPNSGDEYAYLLQAELFASGALTAPGYPERIRDALELDHVISGARLVAKYPPGWPAVLAPAAGLRLAGLVNPLIAGLLVVVTARLLRRVESGWALGTFALAASPFFFWNAGSLHSHLPALLFLTLSLDCVNNQQPRLARAGLYWAVAFLVRPFDALVFALSLPPLLPGRRWWTWAASAAAGPVTLCAYNALVFGTPFTTGYAQYRSTFARLYPAERWTQELSLAHVLHWREHLAWVDELWQWAPLPVCLGLAGLLVARKPASKSAPLARWAAQYAGLIVVSTLFLMPTDGDSYGPRYLFCLLLPLAVGAAHLDLNEAIARSVQYLLVPLVLATALATWRFGEEAHRTIRERTTLEREVARQGLTNAVVLVGMPAPAAPSFFTRNGPALGSVIYARDLGARSNLALNAAFPSRTIYRFRWTSRTEGTLVTLIEGSP